MINKFNYYFVTLIIFGDSVEKYRGTWASLFTVLFLFTVIYFLKISIFIVTILFSNAGVCAEIVAIVPIRHIQFTRVFIRFYSITNLQLTDWKQL